MNNISKNYKYIYVDSLYSINYLKNRVNLKNYILISFNPTLILNKKLKVIGLESNSSPKDFIKLGQVTYKYSGNIFKKVTNISNDKTLGVWIARYLIAIQNTLYRVSKIKKFIKKKKCLLVKLRFNSDKKNSAIHGLFYSYMQQYENCKIIEIDHHPNDLNNIGKDPQTGFWIRLQFESIISILFRLVSILSKKIYKFWPFKIIYYSHENSLLKRIAFKSFIKGYLLLKFPKYSFKVLNEENSFNIFTLEIYKNTKKTLTLYQKTILDTAYTKETEGFFNLKFKNYINEYVTALRFWEKEFAKGTQKKITTGLFGFPSTAMELAFCSLAKKNNIITASFQHAVSKEISKDILSIDSIYESNIVDFYFVYNKYTALNSKFSRFHKSKDIVIGLPEDLRRGMNFKVSKTFNKFPILYASTNLYCGNRGISNRAGASEVDKANFELDLIKNILAKIPHKVEYKPYFAKRYTGESIEINEARSKKIFLLMKMK